MIIKELAESFNYEISFKSKWFIDLSRRKVKNEEKTVENEVKHMKYNWKYPKKLDLSL